MNEKLKSSVPELLYTFFFGYAALKWRRLIRTLIIIPSVGFLISGIVAGPIVGFYYYPDGGYITNYEEDVYSYDCPWSDCDEDFTYNNRYKKEFLIEHFGISDVKYLDGNNFSLLEIGERYYVTDISKEKYLSLKFLEGFRVTFGTIGIFIGLSLVIGLISWLIKPFVVKED